MQEKPMMMMMMMKAGFISFFTPICYTFNNVKALMMSEAYSEPHRTSKMKL